MFINCLAACTIYLQQFPSYSNCKCKKSPFSRTAAHIFVSPRDAPEAITLNVVWMEREFNAYKLSRCMCPSNYNRFWDRARYMWKKSSFYHTPLHSTPQLGGSRRNIGTLFGMEKLEWCRYSKVKKFRRYVYLFWRDPRTWQTDGQTLQDSKDRACIASRGKNAGSKPDLLEDLFLLGLSVVVGLQPRRLVSDICLKVRRTLIYLLTYLLTFGFLHILRFKSIKCVSLSTFIFLDIVGATRSW